MRSEESTSADPSETSTLSDRAKAQAVPVAAVVTAASVLGLFLAGQLFLAFAILVIALCALEAFIWADTRDFHGFGGFKFIFAMVGSLLLVPFGIVATLAILLGLNSAFNLIRLVLLVAFLVLLIWGLATLPFHVVRSLLRKRAQKQCVEERRHI